MRARQQAAAAQGFGSKQRPTSCRACQIGLAQPVRGTNYEGHPFWYQCANCGSQFLVPQPSDVRLAQIYSPSYYDVWDWEERSILEEAKRRTFMRALSKAKLSTDARLLDVGCARGEFAAFAASLGFTVSGIDVNDQAISEAQSAVPGASFVCGELSREKVGAGWDVVTMFDFIEHVRNPVDTLAAAASVLGDHGTLIITTPWAQSVEHRVLGKAWPQYREEHLVLFSSDGLAYALESAGLSIRSAAPATKYVTPAYLLGQAFEYGPRALATLAGRSRPLLSLAPMHRILPIRFGEITVVAHRAVSTTS